MRPLPTHLPTRHVHTNAYTHTHTLTHMRARQSMSLVALQWQCGSAVGFHDEVPLVVIDLPLNCSAVAHLTFGVLPSLWSGLRTSRASSTLSKTASWTRCSAKSCLSQSGTRSSSGKRTARTTTW